MLYLKHGNESHDFLFDNVEAVASRARLEIGPKRFSAVVAQTRHFSFMSFDNARVARDDERLM